jgi:DNA (cytosine-5)-methyltransferase 1
MEMQKHKFPYNWRLSEAKFTKDKGKVFSCFACGGGSTMGYKLAGFDVIGCNEIDPKMMKCYIENHNPQYTFLEDIRNLLHREDLPEELYNLEILDGSPPCSTFSISGSREDAWGKEKKFREGQSAQVLDTLFFDFIALAKVLQPKVVVAENVKGLLMGSAIDYVRRIYKDFDNAGYYCQHFLLDASKMGVPQKRERIFFICIRHDLGINFLNVSNLFNMEPYINMDFKEEPIIYGEFSDYQGKEINSPKLRELWDAHEPKDYDLASACIKLRGKRSFFNYILLKEDCVPPTFIGGHGTMMTEKEPKFLSKNEILKISTFPLDYKTKNQNELEYLCGMSVPPVMMAQIATRIYEQWLSKL